MKNSSIGFLKRSMNAAFPLLLFNTTRIGNERLSSPLPSACGRLRRWRSSQSSFIVYARIFMWLNIFNFRGGTKPTFFNIFAVSLALVGGLALGQGRWERGKRTGKLLYDKEP